MPFSRWGWRHTCSANGSPKGDNHAPDASPDTYADSLAHTDADAATANEAVMLDALYWLASLLAVFGIRRDNWTALPLLGSALFCFLARQFEVPFNLWLWLAVDAVVIAAVAWPLFPIIRARAWVWLLAFRAELAILALFVPAFAGYALPEEPAHILTTVVATAQLLVTVPFRRFAAQWKHTLRRHDEWTHFDLRIAAA